MKCRWTQVAYRIVCGILMIVILMNVLFLFSTSRLKEGQLPRIFGYTPLIENTGSMEPVMKRGDLIFVKETDSAKMDDIIAWYNAERGITTHRIVAVDEDGTYITKGDSNNIQDRSSVDQKQVIGRYSGKLAGFGYILMYLQKPQGLMTVILLIICIGCLALWGLERMENKKLRER